MGLYYMHQVLNPVVSLPSTDPNQVLGPCSRLTTFYYFFFNIFRHTSADVVRIVDVNDWFVGVGEERLHLGTQRRRLVLQVLDPRLRLMLLVDELVQLPEIRSSGQVGFDV